MIPPSSSAHNCGSSLYIYPLFSRVTDNLDRAPFTFYIHNYPLSLSPYSRFQLSFTYFLYIYCFARSIRFFGLDFIMQYLNQLAKAIPGSNFDKFDLNSIRNVIESNSFCFYSSCTYILP